MRSTAAATTAWGSDEQLVFPEINPDKVNTIQGMNITLVTSAKTNDEGRTLAARVGTPAAKGSLRANSPVIDLEKVNGQ